MRAQQRGDAAELAAPGWRFWKVSKCTASDGESPAEARPVDRRVAGKHGRLPLVERHRIPGCYQRSIRQIFPRSCVEAAMRLPFVGLMLGSRSRLPWRLGILSVSAT